MVNNQNVLKSWIVDALNFYQGQAHHIDVAKWVWRNKRDNLYEMGDLFFVWQYKLRWAATSLRQDNILLPSTESPAGTWVLVR